VVSSFLDQRLSLGKDEDIRIRWAAVFSPIHVALVIGT